MLAIRKKVQIRNPYGIHLRMAAALVRIARSSSFCIRIHDSKGRSADPVSIFELMQLGLIEGDWVTVSTPEHQTDNVLNEFCDCLMNYTDTLNICRKTEMPRPDSHAA